MDNTLVILFVLAAFAGAVVGAYIAWQPVAKSVEESVQQTQAETAKTLQEVQKAAQQAGEGLSNISVDVPQPKVVVTLSPWSAFWIFAATVLGFWTAQYWPWKIAPRTRKQKASSRMCKK